MSRPLRIEYPGAWYHVMNRGRRSESIFSDKHDYLMFIDLLIEISEIVNRTQEVYQNQGFESIPGRHWHVAMRDRTFLKTRISVKRLFTKSLFMLQM